MKTRYLILVFLPIMYVMSYGPFYWLYDKDYVSYKAWERGAWTVYYPISYLFWETNFYQTWAWGVFDSYMMWWDKE